MEQEAVTDHNDLVVKYGDRYLTWDNASPVLASLAVYRKSLVEHPEHHQRRIDKNAERPGRGWGSWWRSKGTQNAEEAVSLPATDASPPASPPVSPPESPKSSPAVDTQVPDSPVSVCQDSGSLVLPG